MYLGKKKNMELYKEMGKIMEKWIDTKK